MLNHQQAYSMVSGPVPACARSQIFEFQKLVERKLETNGIRLLIVACFKA